MIQGAKNWKYGDFHSQENNPTEWLLKKFWKKVVHGYLETCGPTAAVNCLKALGYACNCTCIGEYDIQPEEILSDCMNDPRYEPKFRAVRAATHIQGGRIPQFYPLAVKLVFNVTTAKFMWLHNWTKITGYLREGKAIQVQLKRPGHYIALVAYDEEKNEIIYKDSWGRRKGLKNKGLNERMIKTEYDKNVCNYIVVYS